jgi:hypothetical protein
MVAAAVALATKAAEGLSDAGRAALGQLVQLVRGKLRADPDRAALESAQAQPDDDLLVQRLAALLEGAAAQDEAFAVGLTRLWTALRDEWAVAKQGGVVNQVSGAVSGTVVQARDVQGGITFGTR